MKLIRQLTGCGAVMLAIVLSGWAAEPKTDPTTLKELRGASDGLPTEAQKAKVGDQKNPGAPAPVMFTPPGQNAGGPVNTGGPVNAAGRASPFSAEISADFMKKVMETSAKIEAAKRQIAERQAQLYATNPEIKSTRARMIEAQKEINRILDADPELAELKMSRDILLSTMPALPKGQNPASMPRMPVAR